MVASKHRWRSLFLALALWGCAHDPEVVRPSRDDPFMQGIPGPALGGPYDTFSQALLAACEKILKKPYAAAGSHDHPDFIQRWMLSTEYCAWMYYTPDDKYEISKLSNQSRLPPSDRRKSCFLPSSVDDQRYPPGTIKYISALHNHPYGSTLSDSDIRAIVAQGLEHGFEAETKNATVYLSVVAFFSKSFTRPTCDGFHMYLPATRRVLRWTRVSDKWECRQTGVITWHDTENYSLESKDGLCPGELGQ